MVAHKPLEPCHVTVRNDLDIINLRQSVRQMSRALGLDLPHQAKVTVAISTIAQSFLRKVGCVAFTVQVNYVSPHPALEIICVCSDTQHASTSEQFEEYFALRDLHVLVDEVVIALGNDAATLTVREWITT